MIDRLEAALAAVHAANEPLDAFDTVRVEELLRGYHFWWGEEQLQVLAVEEEFCAPLVNPSTGVRSRTWMIAGKLDAVVRNGCVQLVEHKSTSEKITPGSDYWNRLRIEAQISTYFVGARVLGFDVRQCMYDVIAKPRLQPYEANSRRSTPETPEEFRIRYRKHIADNPDAIYARGTVVRLAEEEREAAADMWLTAGAIREARNAKTWGRNPDQCVRFNRTCEYFPVCTGTAEIIGARYRKTDDPHEELASVKHSLPLLTNSAAKAFRTCPRLYFYRYELGYRPVEKAQPLRLGTALHTGLEAWWRAGLREEKKE